jgi:hypothetical protein
VKRQLLLNDILLDTIRFYLISNWIVSNIRNDQTFYNDLGDNSAQPVMDLFTAVRPDIAVVDNVSVTILELTICHK